MLYQPQKTFRMWDTWLYFHNGVHYLFYLHKTTEDHWDGMSVATSTDGVHFDEVGHIIEKRGDVGWLGTGSVWRAGDRFILNFSESREGVQAVFFAESEDLIHWKRLGDEYRSDPDPRWYNDTPSGRWDCIWAIPRVEGGFWGYLTANPWTHEEHPDGLAYRSVGMVESEDGVRWRAVPPPVFEWGETPQTKSEVGAIDRIGGKYYLQLGTFGYMGNRPGMYTFIGESPKGPFHPDREALRLLGSKKEAMYFSRFYRIPGELLVNHHSIGYPEAPDQDIVNRPVGFAPLKRAIVDEAGHLRLGYWPGNEAVKGSASPIDLTSCHQILPDSRTSLNASSSRLEADDRGAGSVCLLGESFDLEKGIVLEGGLEIHPIARRIGWIGFVIEESATRGTALMLQTDGRTEIGPLTYQGEMDFQPDDHIETMGIAPSERCAFRLLLRGGFLELYLDDLLVQCYSLPPESTGRLGLVFGSGRVAFDNVQAWEMTFC